MLVKKQRMAKYSISFNEPEYHDVIKLSQGTGQTIEEFIELTLLNELENAAEVFFEE